MIPVFRSLAALIVLGSFLGADCDGVDVGQLCTDYATVRQCFSRVAPQFQKPPINADQCVKVISDFCNENDTNQLRNLMQCRNPICQLPPYPTGTQRGEQIELACDQQYVIVMSQQCWQAAIQNL